MVKIKKGDTVLTVTNGAYKNYYKHLGYEPVDDAQSGENLTGVVSTPHGDSHDCGDPAMTKIDETAEAPETAENDGEGGVIEEEAEEDLSEIPLSEMKLSQLIAYAEQLGLEHDGTPNKKELRKLIRNHLNQQ